MMNLEVTMKPVPTTLHPFDTSSVFPAALPLNGNSHFFRQQAETEQADDPLLTDLLPADLPSDDLQPTVQLLTIGPLAQVIATYTTAIGATWLAVPPIVHQVAIGADGEQPWPLAANGWAKTNGQPGLGALSSWLLLDLWVDQAPALATAVVDQRITWARQQVQRLAVAAYRTHGDSVTIPLLILADPARPADLDSCRRRLAPLTGGPFYLLGADQETVTTAVWQQRAATTLAALLWANLPAPPSVSKEATAPAQFYTVGAVSEALPTTPLIRMLALLTAQEAVQARLAPPDDKRVDHREDETNALTSLTALVTELLAPAETGPVPPVHLRRTQPRWWRTSARPVAMLLAYHQQQQRTQQAAVRQTQTNRLATQLAQWDTAWQAASRLNARPTTTGIDPLHDVAPFTQLRRQILTLVQSIDETLATVAATTAAHEAATQRECATLTAFCADLPTLSPLGIWHFCRQPRQWPRWLWQLTIGLPWRLRRLSRAVTAQEQTLHQEAEIQQRRQLALAMAQDVQAALGWQQQLQAHLAALATYLDEQITAGLSALPAPWERTRVEALRQELIRRDTVNRQAGMQALTALLQPTAAEAWVDGAVAAIGESLVEPFAAAFSTLQRWSVEAWLRATFPPPSQATTVPEKGRWSRPQKSAPPPAPTALAQWLDHLLQAADPLWPPLTPAADQPVEQWLLLPTDPQHAPSPEPHPDLKSWLDARPDRHYQPVALREIVAVQRVSLL
jgi:hypothetical protein